MALYQSTIRYRTYIKETMVEAMRLVFANHNDQFLRNTKVTVDLPMDRASFPSVIVRFYERRIWNAGIGHYEWVRITPDGTQPELFQRFKHFLYTGDVEFAILGLSSKDRDFMADAIVNIIGMSDTESYMNAFYDRIYNADTSTEPGAKSHFINLKSDDFQGFGDQEELAPWMPEDVLVYRTSYRVPIFGEFYSRELTTGGTNYGKVTKVDVYPYMPPEETLPDPHPEDPAPWVTLDGNIVVSP